MNPSGKVALITGGTRIGRTVAEALARGGCSVAVTYQTSRTAARETVRRVASFGVRATAIHADLSRPPAWSSTVTRVVRTLGRLDILVHMASLYERTPFQTSAQIRGMEKSLAIELRAAHALSLLAAPHMKKAGEGRVLHFADWIAASGRPRYRDHIPYYTAKAGLKGLVEALALELAPAILVNAIAPGPILPPSGLPPRVHKEVLANTPLNRWGGADEIAKAVLFFVQSDFVTGETLRVDGGRHLY